jgi:hypothetical protein
MNGCFLHFLIDQQVGTLAFSPPVLTTEAVHLDIMRIKLSHTLIVKLYPTAFRLLDVAEVMAKFSRSIVQDDSFQGEFII